MRFRSLFLLPLIAIGCMSFDENVSDMPIHELYGKALEHYKSKNYKKAVEFFQAVERQYPFETWTIQAQVMIGYLQYLLKDFESAISSFKLFIELNPHHAHVPYAYYMLGMCYYQQLSIIKREQKSAEEGLEVFTIVYTKFPDTAFATDAKLKADYLRDHMAGKSVDIARFYQSNRSYDAAIGRLIDVVQMYENSKHIPEAKWRLVESYDKLGLREEAKKVALDITKNHDKTEWSNYAQNYVSNFS